MQQKKSWFKSRGYQHLTNKVNPKNDKAYIFQFVKNPKAVAQHAFFPLIHKKIPQRRYKIIDYDKENCPIRGHTKIGKTGKVESTKKLRPIHYATHIDAQIYAYYSREILQSKYESYLKKHPELFDCVSAYRRIPTVNGKSHKNNIHFAKEAFDCIKERGECCALAFDIESFFTNLNHKYLKKAWSKLLEKKSLPKDHYNIFKSITNYSYVSLNDFRVEGRKNFDEYLLTQYRKVGVQAFFASPKDLRKAIQNGELSIYKNQYHDDEGCIRGIPQGLPISAMLANLYLLEFDKLMLEKVVKEFGGVYRRYSDDIVVICNETDYNVIMDFVNKTIQKFKLRISQGKTEICFFRYTKHKETTKLKSIGLVNGREKQNFPFRYLGFEFYGDKVLLKSSNLSKFYRRMKYAVKAKAKRIEHYKKEKLAPNAPLYKRRLYRIYSYQGKKSHKVDVSIMHYRYNTDLSCYYPTQFSSKRQYRGNYLAYVERASKIMNEPAIKHQLRNHWQILQDCIQKRIHDID